MKASRHNSCLYCSPPTSLHWQFLLRICDAWNNQQFVCELLEDGVLTNKFSSKQFNSCLECSTIFYKLEDMS